MHIAFGSYACMNTSKKLSTQHLHRLGFHNSEACRPTIRSVVKTNQSGCSSQMLGNHLSTWSEAIERKTCMIDRYPFELQYSAAPVEAPGLTSPIPQYWNRQSPGAPLKDHTRTAEGIKLLYTTYVCFIK